MAKGDNPVEILFVEDNPGDMRLTALAQIIKLGCLRQRLFSLLYYGVH